MGRTIIQQDGWLPWLWADDLNIALQRAKGYALGDHWQLVWAFVWDLGQKASLPTCPVVHGGHDKAWVGGSAFYLDNRCLVRTPGWSAQKNTLPCFPSLVLSFALNSSLNSFI